MGNICSNTHLKDTSLPSLQKELNFIRKQVCIALGNGGGGGGGTWGSITGTLSNQTDLQDALDAITPYPGDSPDRINGTATVSITSHLLDKSLTIDAINGNESSSFVQTSSSFNFSGATGDATGYGNLSISNGGVSLIYSPDDGSAIGAAIGLSASGAIIELGAGKTFEYSADYSADFTDRSLVDKEYIDNVSLPINLNSPVDGQILKYEAGEFVNTDYATADEVKTALSLPTTGGLIIVAGDLYFGDDENWYKLTIAETIPKIPLTDMTYNSTSGTVTESPSGTWTFASSARASSTTQILSGDGYVRWTIGDQNGLVCALDQTSTLEAYTNFDYAVFFAGGNMYAQYSGSNTNYGDPTGITDLKISRTGSTVTLEKSTDNGDNWTVVHTYGATFSGNLFWKAENVGGGSQYIVNPKGQGF